MAISKDQLALVFAAGAGVGLALGGLIGMRRAASAAPASPPDEEVPPCARRASKPVLKLKYFDIPGKAEPIRLAAAIGGVEMEDIRMSFDEFNAKKAEFPNGQVPCLSVDDKTICQSSAILKYIGKLGGLYPISDAVLAAEIDSILDNEIDMFAGLTVYRYSGRFGFGDVMDDANKDKVNAALNADVLPRHLGYLETRLNQSPTEWVAGTPEPTVADLCLACRISWLQGLDHINDNILSRFPKCEGLIAKVNNLPAVKAYYESRNKA